MFYYQMKYFLFHIILALAVISCDDHQTDRVDSRLTLTKSATGYEHALSGNPDENGDPFNLQDFEIRDDSAFITVSYSGGCRQHTFEVIWNENYDKSNPPGTKLLMLHNANGDACEAFLTETLVFSLSELLGEVAYETVAVTVINGKSQSDSLSRDWHPSAADAFNVVFPEGEQCIIEVTASTVVCGTGLYENLWLALQDSVSTGIDGTYFKKYLQPVALNEEVKNFRPVPGKKYRVGAMVQRSHPYTGIITCLAYPGPSVPVRITCVTEVR